MLGVSYVAREDSRSNFYQYGFIFRKKERKRNVLIQCAIVWVLWLARNQVVFEGVMKDIEGMIPHIKAISWSWVISIKGDNPNFSFFKWKSNPLKCLSQE